MTVRVRGFRVAGLAAASSGAAVWLAQQAAALAAGVSGLAGGADAPTLDDLVAALICASGALAAGYLAVAVVAAWAEAVVTGTWRGRGLPLIARRFLVASVAASVALGPAGPAGATDAYPGWVAPSPSASATTEAQPGAAQPSDEGQHASAPRDAAPDAAPTPDPGSVPTHAPGEGNVEEPATGPATAQAGETGTSPDTQAGWVARPLPAAAPARAVTPQAPHEEPAAARGAGKPPTEMQSTETPGSRAQDEPEPIHVVTRGESLWRIAAARLGPGATDAQIARAWPSLYAANKPLIGDDPGLIFPGQRLRIPAELAQ